MRIERTNDMKLVKEIMTNEKIFDKLTDDGCDSFEPVDTESLWWLAVYDGEEVGGVYFLHPLNSVCYEMHTCLLPSLWGSKANAAAQKLLEYAFNVMKARKVVTNVPECNRLALKYATRNGMKVEGVNRESFLKNGRLENQIMLGITLKEWESCRQYQQ